MYSLLLVLSLALISCHGLAPNTIDADVQLEINEYATEKGNGELVGFLEKFKRTMHTGDKSHGVPILDPLSRDRIDIDNTDLITVKGTLRDVRGSGLSAYRVKKGDFSSSALTANVTLQWTQIALTSKYNVTGRAPNGAPFWGNGTVRVVVRNLEVTVNAKLTEKNGKMAVSRLSSSIHLKAFPIRITGLYDSDHKSKAVSVVLTTLMPKMIEDHQEEVTSYANGLISNMLNKYLKHFTLKEFLNVIKG